MKSLRPTRNDLPRKTRERTVALLNQTLANLTDLASQVRHAHWNVRGSRFYPLHKLFDDLTETLVEHLDPTAERITALGGTAQGTLRRAVANSELAEYPERLDRDLDHVETLADRYAKVASSVRNAIDETAKLGDAGSSDLLTGLVRDLDQGLWLLEAHAERG